MTRTTQSLRRTGDVSLTYLNGHDHSVERNHLETPMRCPTGAKALAFTIPQSLLLQATDIIE